MSETFCPCGLAASLKDCCEPYLFGAKSPETPLRLMRTRYTAYVLRQYEYIKQTMRGKALKQYNPKASQDDNETLTWQGLTILSEELKGPNLGFVSFKAYYLDQEQTGVIAEKSEFHRIEGVWYYMDGKALNPHIKTTLAADAPCLCGSQRPYHHCCAHKETFS